MVTMDSMFLFNDFFNYFDTFKPFLRHYLFSANIVT